MVDAFPPINPADIEAYPIEDCVAGYLSHERGDLVPGPNHAPGYRWGWLNCQYDRSNGKPDGHEAVRHAYAREKYGRDAAPAPRPARRPGEMLRRLGDGG